MSLMTELRYSGTVTPNRIKRKARRKIEARSDQKSDVHDACAEVIQAAAKRLSSTEVMSGYRAALACPVGQLPYNPVVWLLPCPAMFSTAGTGGLISIIGRLE